MASSRKRPLAASDTCSEAPLTLHAQRVKDLYDALCGEGQLRETEVDREYERFAERRCGWHVVRGVFGHSHGEGAQLAQLIHAFAGYAVVDTELRGEHQRPWYLVVTYEEWSQEELQTRKGALGLVQHLMLYNTVGFIPPSQWQSLHTLTLCGGKYDISSLPLEHLRELHLLFGAKVTPDIVGARLSLAAFTSCERFPSSLLRGSHDSLQHLEIRGDDDTVALCALPNLQSLRFEYMTDTVFAVQDWASLKKLRRLDITLGFGLTVSSYAQLPPALTHLSLVGTDIDNESLRVVTQRCPLLQVIDVRYCHTITADGYAALEEECKALRSLRLGHDWFDDEMMACIAASPFLSQCVTFLDLGCNPHVSSAALVAFLAACPNLRGINILYIESINPTCLTAAVVATCPSLEVVHCHKDVVLPVTGLAVYCDYPEFDLRHDK